jgi:hypothetical protein
MGWRRIALFVVAGALGVGGATALAAGSSKAPSSFVTYQSTLVSSGTQGNTKEGCGSETTGGGGGITEQTFGAFAVSLATSYPFDSATWQVYGNDRGPNAASLIAVVVCASGYDLHIKDGSASLAPHTSRTKQVACPRGSSVTGGGVFIAGTATSIVVSTTAPFDGKDGDRRPDDGWLGRANNGSALPEDMTTYAICSKNGRFDYAHGSSKLGSKGEALAQARCPKNDSVVGGGAGISKGGLPTQLTYTQPYDGPDADSDPDDGWVSDATNHGAKGGHTLTSWAVCARS